MDLRSDNQHRKEKRSNGKTGRRWQLREDGRPSQGRVVGRGEAKRTRSDGNWAGAQARCFLEEPRN